MGGKKKIARRNKIPGNNASPSIARKYFAGPRHSRWRHPQREFGLMVKAEMSPIDAITSATTHAAGNKRAIAERTHYREDMRLRAQRRTSSRNGSAILTIQSNGKFA